MSKIKTPVPKKLTNGKTRVYHDLDEGDTVLVIRKNSFYKTGYPHEQVLASHILADANEVTWASEEQDWID